MWIYPVNLMNIDFLMTTMVALDIVTLCSTQDVTQAVTWELYIHLKYISNIIFMTEMVFMNHFGITKKSLPKVNIWSKNQKQWESWTVQDYMASVIYQLFHFLLKGRHN